MIRRYRVAPAALDDIDRAAGYLASENPKAARRLIEELYRACDQIAQSPHIGHRRRDLTAADVFFWPAFGNRYAVNYRKTNSVDIVRVLAWKQDIPTWLGEPDGAEGCACDGLISRPFRLDRRAAAPYLPANSGQ